MSFAQFFDRIIVLHLERRVDRLAHVNAEMARLGISRWDWFDGYDKPDGNGNRGCSESHRGILELIAFNKWERVLVLEDDFALRPEFYGNFNEKFAEMIAEVPAGARIIYLGGGYADTPKRRVSKHVIEVNRMMTTSSFIIGWKMAREMAPYISGNGPIDSLFSGFTERGHCYCISPRMFVQYTSMSDLTDREVNYEMSMTDSRHEEMLVDGEWDNWRGTSCRPLRSELLRRELAASTDMNGTELIVAGERWIVIGIELPAHPAPWFRGEKVTYLLARA